MIALLSALALAAPEPPRAVTVGAGLGAAILAGGNGAAWTPGFAQRFWLGGAISRVSVIDVQADHASYTLRDASVYFPDTPIPADAMAGLRDDWAVDLGVRVGLDLGDPSRRTPALVRVHPWLRAGVGALFTHTEVDAPSFDGALAIAGDHVGPLLDLGVGAEIRIGKYASIVPAMRLQMTVAEDTGEQHAKSRWALEMRALPSLDAAVSF